MLYDNNKAIKERQESKKRQQDEELKSKMKQVYTQDQSNRLIERKKIQRFGEIFKQLDSDGDEHISA